MVIIQKGNYETPPLRTFGSDIPYVKLPKIFLPSQHNMNQPIPTTFAMKMFMYCKSLKEVTPRDLYAKMISIKLSQLARDLHEKDLK